MYILYSIFLVPLLSSISYYFVRDQLVNYDIPLKAPARNQKTNDNDTPQHPHFARWTLSIDVGNDERIHTWIFLPRISTAENPVPVVIMAHGLGSQKDMGLEIYAERFASAGLGVVIMDYISFGGSTSPRDSKIRNHINPWNHIRDIIKVVNYVSSGELGPLFDSQRIGLWGTSFAGGHMIMVAAKVGHDIKCVVSQVPHLNGKAASGRGIKQRGFLGTLKVFIIAGTDILRGMVGMSPLYVKIVGSKDDVAYMMLTPPEIQSYFSKHPKVYLGGWQNAAPARTMLTLSLYNPLRTVETVKRPLLLIGASQDTLCPLEFIRKAVTRAAVVPEYLELDCGHFDVYTGKYFEQAIARTVEFLQTNLMVTVE